MVATTLPVELHGYIRDFFLESIGPEDLGLTGSWNKRTRNSQYDPRRVARQEVSNLVSVSISWARNIRKKRFATRLGLLDEEHATQFWEWARHSSVGRLECASLIKDLKIRALPCDKGSNRKKRLSDERMTTQFVRMLRTFKNLETLEIHTFFPDQDFDVPFEKLIHGSNLKNVSLIHELKDHFDIFPSWISFPLFR